MRDAPLSYSTEEGSRAGTTVVKLVGPLTLSNMFAFQDFFRGLDAPFLIFDMSEVGYMDSAGLGLLMNGYVSAENNKRKFLLASVNDRVMALVQMTKLDSVLKIYPSVEAAESAI